MPTWRPTVFGPSLINLRPKNEFDSFDEAAVTARLGMDYVTFPIAGGDDLTREKISAFARVLEDAQSRGPV